MTKTNLLRVTQMNAIYFDKELLNVFKLHIQEFLKYLPPGLTAKYEPEINLFIRLIMLNYSVISNNSTFGQKLLSIKYKNMSATKKLLFIMADCVDYTKERMEMWKPSHIFNKYLYNMTSVVRFLQFWNMCVFLRSGTKPQLIERVLCLEQVYSKDNAQRHYEDKYMTRELIWNGFIEVLVYMLPLINYHKITRNIRNLNPLHKKPEMLGIDHRVITHSTRCAHCNEYPILPYHMGCAHMFCYYCLKGNQEADPKYECPICEFRGSNLICLRVHSDH